MTKSDWGEGIPSHREGVGESSGQRKKGGYMWSSDLRCPQAGCEYVSGSPLAAGDKDPGVEWA